MKVQLQDTSDGLDIAIELLITDEYENIIFSWGSKDSQQITLDLHEFEKALKFLKK